jgi:hypothetical protein
VAILCQTRGLRLSVVPGFQRSTGIEFLDGSRGLHLFREGFTALIERAAA